MLAFFAAPTAGVAAYSLALWVVRGRPPLVGEPIAAALIAYVATVAFGVPLYVLTRSWGSRSVVFYIASALLVAALPATAIGLALQSLTLALIAAACGLPAGLCFWFLVEKWPNSSLEHSRDR